MRMQITIVISGLFMCTVLTEVPETVNAERWLASAVVEEPYFTHSPYDSRDYGGYVKSALACIAPYAGAEVDYVLHTNHGRLNDDGSWSGALGDVYKGKVNLTAIPISPNEYLVDYFDFTIPYLTFGHSLVFLRDDVAKANGVFDPLCFFLRPFAADVWFCLVLFFCFVLLALCLLRKFHPCETLADSSEPDFGWLEIPWVVTSGLVLQGYTTRPRSLASRTVIIVWWVFSIIIFATYLAKLTKMAPFDRPPSPYFTSFLDVSNFFNENFKTMGAVDGSTAWRRIHSSSDNEDMIIDDWKRTKKVLQRLQDLEEGIIRVRRGGFILVVDDPTADYLVHKYCDLTGMRHFGSSDRFHYDGYEYAFAVKKGSPLLPRINKAILMGQRKKHCFAHYYHEKWNQKTTCPKPLLFQPDISGVDNDDPVQYKSITMKSLGGPFLLVFVGLIIATAIAAAEVFFLRRQMQHKARREEAKADDGILPDEPLTENKTV